VVAPTQATLAAAHLKSTQQRIAAEREADRAAGYNEEEESVVVEEDEGDEAGEESAEASAIADENKPMTKEQEATLRRLQNRQKLAQKRANEQFGLP